MKLHPLFLSSAACLLVGGLSLAAAPTALAGSARPNGSFLSVSLPGTPSNESGVRDTIVGDIHHNTLSSDSGDAELSISASVLPGAVTTLTTEDMLYRKARRELVGNYGGSVTGWGECEHAGHECRKLRYSTSDGRKGMARLYISDDVIVVVNAVYSEDEAKARKFLASAR